MTKRKGGIENLQPVRSKEEARQRGSNGGKKSVAVRRERKKAKECMEMILALDAKGENAKKMMSSMGIAAEDQQNIMLLMATMFAKAATTGDPNAIKSILEIVGDMRTEQGGEEKPTINITVSAATLEDMEEDE